MTVACFWCGGFWSHTCDMCSTCGMTAERHEDIKYSVHGQFTLSPIHSLFKFIGRLREPRQRPPIAIERLDLQDDGQWSRLFGGRQRTARRRRP